MSINAGYFPHGGRRKHATGAYQISLSNHRTQNSNTLPSARSAIESTNTNDSFLPVISSAMGANETHKPYRRNDFANNHLFIAKRKLARIFLGEPTKNLQATSDLIHLFDHQAPKRKNRNVNKQQQQQRRENSSNKSSPIEQDAHVSIVNLVIRPPHPSKQTRDPLSALVRNRRTQQVNYSARTRDSSSEIMNGSNKQSLVSAAVNTTTETNPLIEIINHEHAPDTTDNPFYSSLLCVKAMVPSAVPHHPHHHLLQHH